MSPKNTNISAEKVVTVSFLVDVSDVLINVFLTIISGSAIMLSQALQGGAGLLASGLLVVGANKSKRAPDKKHPFGYGREIYFWTFISALVTFTITAGMSFFLGLQRFLNPESVKNVNYVIIFLLISIFTNGYAMSLSFRRLLGKNVYTKIFEIFLHSSFITTKTAFVLDLMGTVASIIGLISITIYKLTGNQRFDGAGSMVIGVILAVLTIYILKSAKDLLVGQSASVKIENRIRTSVKDLKEVKEIIMLRTLHMGTGTLLVDIEVNLENNLTTDEIELLVDKIQHSITTDVPQAKEVRVSLETPSK